MNVILSLKRAADGVAEKGSTMGAIPDGSTPNVCRTLERQTEDVEDV